MLDIPPREIEFEVLRRHSAGFNPRDLAAAKYGPDAAGNPSADGQIVRVPIPQLTAERRGELAKAAGRYAEGARIAVRGVRRDGMEQIKAFEKKSELSKDEAGDWSDEVQKLTDSYVKRVDEYASEKDREIRQV